MENKRVKTNICGLDYVVSENQLISCPALFPRDQYLYYFSDDNDYIIKCLVLSVAHNMSTLKVVSVEKAIIKQEANSETVYKLDSMHESFLKMTKKELVEYASTEIGIELKPSSKKDRMIEIIEEPLMED